MTRTVRATIEIADSSCPVARASETMATPIEDVTRSTVTDGDTIVEEFTVADGSRRASNTGSDEPSAEPAEVEPLFDCGSHTVYRFERESKTTCVCACLEAIGCPVSDVRAVDGSLVVTCYLSDAEQFRSAVTALRERFDEVAVRELTRGGGPAASDLRLVDRRKLTERQRSALETAAEMGYFAYPKGANAGDVAAALGVSRSTFTEQLSAAQRKVFDDLVE
jgi:predicted DNA binding protein